MVSILVFMAMVQYVQSTSELEDEIIVDAKPVPIVGKSEPVTPPIDFTTKETVQEVSMEGEGIPPPPVFTEAEIKTWPVCISFGWFCLYLLDLFFYSYFSSHSNYSIILILFFFLDCY